MLVIQATKVKKYFGDRLILSIPELKIYKKEKIGIVGLNGAGKTTLLLILAGLISVDEGSIKRDADYTFIRQVGDMVDYSSGFERQSISFTNDGEISLSGGEITKRKITAAISNQTEILFADEPTCNLDLDGILLVERFLQQYGGALMLISHDREFLDKICTKIIEIKDGECKVYPGNYSAYVEQADIELKHQKQEYQKYLDTKYSLESAVTSLQGKTRKMKKTPKRMGNSEARLHKRSATEKAEKLHKSVQGIKTRLEKLEKVDRPEENEEIKLIFHPADEPIGKTLVQAENLNFSFGEKILFEGLNFSLQKGSKTALVGKNGTGKSTLIKMIVSRDERLKFAKNLKISYLSQNLDIIDNSKSVLENVLSTSQYPEWMSRTILDNMLFSRNVVNKKAAVLSGGERVKLAIAKLLAEKTNLLILDEPTNYLDIYSMEALERVLSAYKSSLLFTSHDRRFVENVADTIFTLK